MSERDVALFNANQKLRELIPDPKLRDEVGRLVLTYFVLRKDVNIRLSNLIFLLRNWQCESEDYSHEEQRRLVGLIHEQLGDLLK